MRTRPPIRRVDLITRLLIAASLLLGPLTGPGRPAQAALPAPVAAEPPPAAPLRLYYLPFLATADSGLPPALAALTPAGLSVVVAEPIPGGEQAALSSAGAAVLFLDQTVAVIAPPAAYSATVTLTLRPAVAQSADADLAFTLEAQTPAGQPVAQADAPLRLVVDLRARAPEPGRNFFLAYADPQTPGLWHRPELTVHDPAGLLSVTTTHFSDWAAGSEPAPWKPKPLLPGVSTFSGAAAFNYPIAVPAGRGGLQPNVDLSYSSRAADGLITSSDQDQGPLGLGWSLNTTEISRRGIFSADSGLVYPDAYTLVLNGQSYRLFPAPAADPARDPSVRYYAENGPHLFIERRFDPAAPNTDKLYWWVQTPDGAAHRLGWTPDAEVTQSGATAGLAGHPGAAEAVGVRWLVDTVTDVFGNQVQHNYENWLKPDGALVSEGARPAEIGYNFAAPAPDARTRAAGPAASRLVFLASDNHRIKQIQLFNVDPARPVRVVELGLEGRAYSGAANCGQTSVSNLVTSLHEIGADGVSRRPAVRFTYQALAHAGGCYPFFYLREVDNGAGGRLRFTYADDGRVEPLYGQPRPPAYGRSYLVSQTETWDGLNPEPALTMYAYARPCYDHGGDLGTLAEAFDCVQQAAVTVPGFPPYQEIGGLVGFASATVTAYDYGGRRPLQRTVTAFSQEPLTVGRPERVETLGWTDGAWVVLQTATTEYASSLVAAGPARAAQVRATAVTTSDGGEAVTTRVEFPRYDAFGNLLERVEYDLAGQPYRRTLDTYGVNTAAGVWITNALVGHQVFAREGAGWGAQPVRATWTLFNPRGDPARPEPDALGRPVVSRQSAGDGRWVDTQYAYDIWGRPLATTTYADFGAAGRLASQSPRVTRTEYGGPAELYAARLINALGHAIQVDFDPRLGQPVSVTDPNGALTRYEYDAFGRLTAVIRPGDSAAAPTTRYVYVESELPVRVETHQRLVSGCAVCERGQSEFSDGLGRVVQTRTTAEAGQQSVVNTRYDALGRVVYSYLPAPEPASGFQRPAGWESRPRVFTEYDALGRAVRALAADGAVTVNAYRGPRTLALDANGRQRLSERDAFGRLTLVGEYLAGPFAAPDFDRAPDSLIHYSYDAADALTGVATISTTTVITYNALGQKTALNDPGLGAWTYNYGPAGELLAQTDANGVITRFTYDALGRPTSVRWEAPAGRDTLIPSPVSHLYDEGGAAAFALGRRTRLMDGTGVTTWTYDARGRVTSEARQLPAGLGVYTLGYRYTAADKLSELVYPDGERVTLEADALGRPTGLASSLGLAYVADAGYDELERLTALTLGNGLTERRDYYAPTVAQQGGRLARLTVGADLLDLAYAYDAAGNLTRLTDASAGLGETQITTLAYDALDRLLSAATTGAPAGAFAHTYQYDALGRLAARTASGQTRTYAYADPAHLHAATAFGEDSAYAYDANGQMTERREAGLTYQQTWTAAGQLGRVAWVEAGRAYTTTFAYDGDGRRALRLEAEAGSVIATVYLAGLYETQLDVTGLDLTRWLYPPAGLRRPTAGLARPAERDYTGPGDRAVLTWAPPEYAWVGVQVSASAASCENKPGAPAPGAECGDPPVFETLAECEAYGGAPCQNGERYLQTGGGYTVTTTYAPAGLAAGLTCAYGLDGWCREAATLTLTGTETLPGESIVAVSYSREADGASSQTLGGNPRTVLITDTTPVTYSAWAESSFGDQSPLITLPVKVDTQPPTILVGGPAPGVWHASAGVITYTVTDATSGPRCIRAAWEAWPADDAACAVTASSLTFPGAGAHTLYLRAWDQAGQAAVWSGVYFYDPTPPEITGPAITACAADDQWQNACNTPTFTWPAALEADSGLAGYDVYWGVDPAGVGAAWTASAAFTAGSTPEGTRYLRVRARDQAGQVSSWATLFTFRYDASGPAASVSLAGLNGEADWFWSDVTAAILVTDTLSGPAQTQARLDGGGWTPVTDTLTVAGDGWHTLEVQAQDAAGNWGLPVAQAVHIDTTAPSLAAASAAEVSAQNVISGVWQNRVADPAFAWTGALDALTGAPAGYHVYWGEDPAGTDIQDSGPAFDPAGPLPSGAVRYLRAQARDQAGHWSDWRTLFTFQLDHTAPEITALWPANGQVLTEARPTLTAAWVNAAPGAGLGMVALALDQVIVSATVTADGLTYTPTAPLLPGPHTMWLTVADAAGNQATAQHTFHVDPDTFLQIVAPPAEARLNAPAAAVILEGEPGAAVTVTVGSVEIIGALDAAGRLEMAGVTLAAGLNTLQAQARDAAGNTAAQTITVTVDAGQDVAGLRLEQTAWNPRQGPGVVYVTALAGGGRAVEAWALEVQPSVGAPVIVQAGVGPAVEQAVAWDGRNAAGGWAEEGVYTARVVLTTTGGLVTASAPLAWSLVSAAPAPPTLTCGPEGALWYSQPPALARGTAPAGLRVVVYQDDAPLATTPVFNGAWQQMIALSQGAPYSATVTARTLDAAGNLSAPSAACRMGLSQTDPFTTPHASLAASIIGLNAAVELTAATRAIGAPLTAAGVRVAAPAGLGAPALTRAGVTADAQWWTGVWQLPGIGDWEGPAPIIFSAVDTAQPVPNTGAQFLQPYVDLVPPVARLIWPGNDHGQAAASLTPQGTAEPFSEVTVTARRLDTDAALTAAGPADEVGRWRAELTLPDGAYALSAQARDRAGNLWPASPPVTITVDTAGPVLGVVTLTPSAVQPGQSLTISLPVHDVTGRVVAVSVEAQDWPQVGEVAPMTLRPAGPVYTGVLAAGQDAAEGARSLIIRAVDDLGNVSLLTETNLIVDGVSPALQIPTLSANGSYLEVAGAVAYYGPRTTGSLMVTATAGDEAGPHLTAGLEALRFPALFDAEAQTVTGAGARAPITHTRTYTPTGVVTGSFAVAAQDRAGNLTTRAFEVRYDALPPTVTLSAPAVAGLRFAVRWAGEDEGAGLAGYEAQVRVGATGAWTGWLTDTLEIGQGFTGVDGQTYAFRVRAVDRVGNVSEWQEAGVAVSATVKYYLFGGQRRVMRQGPAVYYLHTDHLGSAAVVTEAAGRVVSQARYLPFGEPRWTAGAAPSDYAYTGQRREDFGLLDYNARYYAPALGQFISADWAAPTVQSLPALNRFAYVLYNPYKYTDPTGHYQQLCDEACENNGGSFRIAGQIVNNADQYRLSADQYAHLALFAESSNGSHPDTIIYLMSWVAQNSIGQATDAFDYADKFFYGLRDILRTFLPKYDLRPAAELPSALKLYLYKRAYDWYSRYAYRDERGLGDEFDKVTTLYAMAKTDRANGVADPTNGSSMFNHASYTRYDRSTWVLVGAGGIQSPEHFVAVLTANFEKYRAQKRPDFTYSLYIYPPDWPQVGGLVLVTGNRVCIQGWNGCGAYLP